MRKRLIILVSAAVGTLFIMLLSCPGRQALEIRFVCFETHPGVLPPRGAFIISNCGPNTLIAEACTDEPAGRHWRVQLSPGQTTTVSASIPTNTLPARVEAEYFGISSYPVRVWLDELLVHKLHLTRRRHFFGRVACSAPIEFQSRTPDPIDRLVTDLASTHGMWVNGWYSLVDLPRTASMKEVTKAVFQTAYFDPPLTNYNIRTSRQVYIPSPDSEPYTAVLLETNLGQKIVLLKYERAGWWNRVYAAEAKVPAWSLADRTF